MSTEAGAAEGTGPPDMLPEDNTCEDTAESVYRRERELEGTSSEPAMPIAEMNVIQLGNEGSDTGSVGQEGSPSSSGQSQEDDRMEEVEEDDISEKARRYIAKKKEEAKAHIRALFADKINTYEAIKRHNLRAMAVSNLLGGLAIDQQMESDLFAGGDGRICKTIVRADFGAKINASYSFKPSTMQCLGCQPRHQLDTVTRAVFVLSDQDFPPALPCQNGGQCLFIFRMENGTLSELVDDFLEMTKGWRLPPGHCDNCHIHIPAEQMRHGGVCRLACPQRRPYSEGLRRQRGVDPGGANPRMRQQQQGAHQEPVGDI